MEEYILTKGMAKTFSDKNFSFITVQAGQQAPPSLCMKSAVYPNLMRGPTSVPPEMMLVCSTFYYRQKSFA